MRAPGRATHTTAGLDAQTPGVRTTRLVRPRTSSLGLRELACAHVRSHAKTLSASCRTREAIAHGQSRPAIPITPDAVASIAPQPAVRDDRDPPLVSGLGVSCVRQIRNSVKRNISRAGLDKRSGQGGRGCFASPGSDGLIATIGALSLPAWEPIPRTLIWIKAVCGQGARALCHFEELQCARWF